MLLNVDNFYFFLLIIYLLVYINPTSSNLSTHLMLPKLFQMLWSFQRLYFNHFEHIMFPGHCSNKFPKIKMDM